MLTRRSILILLPSIFFFKPTHETKSPAWIGAEEDSTLGGFDEANAPSEEGMYVSFIREPREEDLAVNLNAFGANEIAKRLTDPSDRAPPLASFLD